MTQYTREQKMEIIDNALEQTIRYFMNVLDNRIDFNAYADKKQFLRTLIWKELKADDQD